MLGQDPSKYMITIFWKKNKKLFRVIFFYAWGDKLAQVASVITIFISNFGNLLSQKHSHVFFVICNNFLQSSKYITFSSKLFQCCFYFQVGFKFGRYFFVGINICSMLSFLLKLQGNLQAIWSPKLLKKIHFVFIAQKYFARRNFFCVKRFFAQKKK